MKFELTERTRDALDAYLKSMKTATRGFLFPSRQRLDLPMTTRQYALLANDWVSSIGLDTSFFGTHQLRRTKATLIYHSRPFLVRLRPERWAERVRCPGISDVNLLGHSERVVDSNPEFSDGAFDLRVAQQQLDWSENPVRRYS